MIILMYFLLKKGLLSEISDATRYVLSLDVGLCLKVAWPTTYRETTLMLVTRRGGTTQRLQSLHHVTIEGR